MRVSRDRQAEIERLETIPIIAYLLFIAILECLRQLIDVAATRPRNLLILGSSISPSRIARRFPTGRGIRLVNGPVYLIAFGWISYAESHVLKAVAPSALTITIWRESSVGD